MRIIEWLPEGGPVDPGPFRLAENRIPIIARGGGSGLAGQAIGAGIILDFSKYMNEIKEINTENNYIIVQPGIYKSVLDSCPCAGFAELCNYSVLL